MLRSINHKQEHTLRFISSLINCPDDVCVSSIQYIGHSRKYQTNGFQVVVGLLLSLLLFIVTPIVGVCNCSRFCCTLLYVPSSFAITLMGKRELVALLSLSS